ncbi:MAG: CPXCG motif-containing cysteine-rich protein [Candidatus Sumerlaeaceae bacterium]|nr:CPXCG motif-containing cysteine-rich protein [Candidatus Sumerlaeaceae bacterium]
MLTGGTYLCAYCGERNEVEVDVSAGRHQRYTEDCQICCRPNLLIVEVAPDAESVVIEAEREND